MLICVDRNFDVFSIFNSDDYSISELSYEDVKKIIRYKRIDNVTIYETEHCLFEIDFIGNFNNNKHLLKYYNVIHRFSDNICVLSNQYIGTIIFKDHKRVFEIPTRCLGLTCFELQESLYLLSLQCFEHSQGTALYVYYDKETDILDIKIIRGYERLPFFSEYGIHLIPDILVRESDYFINKYTGAKYKYDYETKTYTTENNTQILELNSKLSKENLEIAENWINTMFPRALNYYNLAKKRITDMQSVLMSLLEEALFSYDIDVLNISDWKDKVTEDWVNTINILVNSDEQIIQYRKDIASILGMLDFQFRFLYNSETETESKDIIRLIYCRPTGLFAPIQDNIIDYEYFELDKLDFKLGELHESDLYLARAIVINERNIVKVRLC